MGPNPFNESLPRHSIGSERDNDAANSEVYQKAVEEKQKARRGKDEPGEDLAAKAFRTTVIDRPQRTLNQESRRWQQQEANARDAMNAPGKSWSVPGRVHFEESPCLHKEYPQNYQR